jgi:anti-sigma B factor antagonist
LSEERAVRAGVLSVQIAEEEGTRRIRLSGELDLANASALETELNRALGNGDERVIVDLSELSFIDSTGIALLINAVARDDGGDRLRFVPSRGLAVQRVLKATGLDERLPFLDGSS